MKNKLFWLILVLGVIAIIFSFVKKPTQENIDFKPLEVNVGDEFTYLSYDNKMYVLNYMIKDVTGDGTNDMVMVIGEKEKVEDLMAKNMDIVVYEPNEKQFYNMNLKNANGEMPKIESYDVTGDGILDIILCANDGSGCIIVRIASNRNGEWKEILKAKDNKGIAFQGQFQDGFKANVTCNPYVKEMSLDVCDKKENYITNGFYDESGRLLQSDSKITTTPFVQLDFVQLEGCFGIQTMQRIIGFNQDDILDEITVIWKYENGKWVAKEAKGNLVGNLLY